MATKQIYCISCDKVVGPAGMENYYCDNCNLTFVSVEDNKDLKWVYSKDCPKCNYHTLTGYKKIGKEELTIECLNLDCDYQEEPKKPKKPKKPSNEKICKKNTTPTPTPIPVPKPMTGLNCTLEMENLKPLDNTYYYIYADNSYKGKYHTNSDSFKVDINGGISIPKSNVRTVVSQSGLYLAGENILALSLIDYFTHAITDYNNHLEEFKRDLQSANEVVNMSVGVPPNLVHQDIKQDNMKHDDMKHPMDLLPWKALEEVSDVLGFGKKKYNERGWFDNCKSAEDMKRYETALIRHFAEWKQGITIDDETGMHVLAHMACNALFLLELKDKFLDYNGKDILVSELEDAVNGRR